MTARHAAPGRRWSTAARRHVARHGYAGSWRERGDQLAALGEHPTLPILLPAGWSQHVVPPALPVAILGAGLVGSAL